MIPKRFLIMAMLIIGALTACNGHSNTLDLSGTLELTEHAVGPNAVGRLVTLTIEEGSQVAKGDVIATLDRYEQTKKDYDRLAKLLKSGGTTEQTVERARLSMEDQRVVAPIHGVVLVKIHELGEVVVAGSPIAVLGDSAHPWIRVYVPEGYINRIQLEQTVTLHFDGVTKKITGHVIYISPQAEFTPRNVQTKEERITQTFAVKIALDETTSFVHPGSNADVIIPLMQRESQ